MKQINDRQDSPAVETVLFGKIPARGDFVRVRMQSAVAFAFEAWLTRAVELAKGRLPETPVRFLLDLASAAERAPLRLVGSFIASEDTVGRAFPIVAFRAVPDDLAEAPWVALPAFYAPFFDSAEGLLQLGRGTTAELLAESLAHSVEPHPSSLPAAWGKARETLSQESVDAFVARVFGPGDHGDLAYALNTIRQACAQPASSEAGLMLDAPIARSSDLFVWLELVRAALGPERSMPSIVWSAAEERALVVLGPPPEVLLSVLLDREHPSQRRWPLWTSRKQAVEVARSSLPPDVAHVLSSSGTLLSLRDAIEREG